MPKSIADHELNFIRVELPSGAPVKIHKEEVDVFNKRVKQYLSENAFSNVSDFQDLDRVVVLELFIWRYGQWLLMDHDYEGVVIDRQECQKAIKENSVEVRAVKAALNLDKKSRDQNKGTESVADFIQKLGIRARHFGYARNKQMDKMLEIGNDLRALITLYKNCTPEERRHLRCTEEHVMNWIENVFITEYDEIDKAFRDGTDGGEGQKLWVGEV